MHFLSEGRDRRVRRWIAEQNSRGTSENAEADTENPTTSRFSDHLESMQRREHDARADMNWEMEELERETALTAYAFGKQSWRLSLLSVNASKLDLASLKRLSQLTVKSLEGQLGHNAEDDLSSDAPPITYDERRGARIVSQPPVLPDSPTEVDLPFPFLHRCVPPPAPIVTSAPSTNGPPITFILQESASPLPNMLHFTHTPIDVDAFPSTPRSFTSFGKRLSDGKTAVQELFLSPRLPQSPPTAPAMQAEMHSLVSPVTSYTYSSASDISMSLLSAFPSAPATQYSPHEYLFGSKTDPVPPVPDLPSDFANNSKPIHGEYVAGCDKTLPPPPPQISFESHLDDLVRQEHDNSVLSISAQSHDRSTTPLAPSSLLVPYSTPDDDNAMSDLASDISDQFSSRFSLYSSRFSVSSLESGRTPGSKWSHFQFGKTRSRTATVTASTTGFGKGTGRARSHSNAGSNMGHSKSITHSRTTSRAESRAGITPRTDIRAESRLETLSRANSRNQPHPTNSPNESRPLPSTEACRSRGGLHLRSQSNPLLSTPVHEMPMTEQASHEDEPVEAHDSQESPQRTKRTIMSRLGDGLKRSKSSGTLPRPRPPRQQCPSASTNIPTKTHKLSPSFARFPCIPSPADICEPEQSLPPKKSLQGHSSEEFTPRSKTPAGSSPTWAGSENSSPVKSASSPKTPASSSSMSSFFQFGRSSSKSEEDCLVIQGVPCDNECENAMRRWCENQGSVKKVTRCPKTRSLIVHFRRNANKRGVSVSPYKVNVPEIGIVTISWT